MRKLDLERAVYRRMGNLSREQSAELVDQIFETMKEMLGRGEQVRIKGFGRFILRDKRSRQGRNPQTGVAITLIERRVLTFKIGLALRLALNPRVAAPSVASGPNDVDEDHHRC
ncbi:MAG: integration host factor subunit alpha [Byssovorax sp.]